MRLRRRISSGEIREDGVIPLINIVLLLLIFFLLAGRIATPEAADVRPPSSTSAPGDPADPATLEVTAAGEVRYLGDLRDLMAAATAVALAVGDGEAVIRADRAAPAERVLEVAAALRMARVERSRLVVESGR